MGTQLRAAAIHVILLVSDSYVYASIHIVRREAFILSRDWLLRTQQREGKRTNRTLKLGEN